MLHSMVGISYYQTVTKLKPRNAITLLVHSQASRIRSGDSRFTGLFLGSVLAQEQMPRRTEQATSFEFDFGNLGRVAFHILALGSFFPELSLMRWLPKKFKI